MNSSRDCVRVFVAATESEWLPARVLEFSMRETTASPIEFTRIYSTGRKIPIPLSPKNQPRTPFSFQRFLVPELCGFKGKAIYLDSDMQVFKNIGELWDWPLNGYDLQTVSGEQVGRRSQFSVMLLQCERLTWDIDVIVAGLDAGKLSYTGLMDDMCVAARVGRDISPHWNAMETFDPENTCLLHYTDMHTQPWVSTANPLGYLWIACLRRAQLNGFISRVDIDIAIRKGHVRPSLAAHLDSGIDHTEDLRSSICSLDRNFIAPYRGQNLRQGVLSRLLSNKLRGAILKRIARNF